MNNLLNSFIFTYILLNLISLVCAIKIIENPAVELAIKNTPNALEDTVENIASINIIEDKIANLVNETLHADLDNEDLYLNTTELLRKNGFEVEEYEVETEDGYILLLIRIRGSGTSILLIHGILLSSDDWVTPGPKVGIALMLAAKGYDVWIGNARGNTYSKKHKTLTTDEAEFWDFSYDEIGRYDLPALIDHILNVTERDKLIYVGFSQGTTTFFIMASERPEYNSKVSLMIALAPISAANFKSKFYLQLKALTHNKPQIFFKRLRLAGVYELFPRTGLTALVCSRSLSRNTFCTAGLDYFAGYNGLQSYQPTLSVVFSHLPSGCSTKQMEHYGQAISSQRFAKFDYGTLKNMKLYSSKIPPEYPIRNITAPLAFFYGLSDLLAPPENVRRLRRQLPSVVEFYKVRPATFGHLDFVYGKDLKKLVVKKMLKLIKEYE